MNTWDLRSSQERQAASWERQGPPREVRAQGAVSPLGAPGVSPAGVDVLVHILNRPRAKGLRNRRFTRATYELSERQAARRPG